MIKQETRCQFLNTLGKSTSQEIVKGQYWTVRGKGIAPSLVSIAPESALTCGIF